MNIRAILRPALVLATVTLLSVALYAACGGSGGPDPSPKPGLSGGVLATFAVGDEQFKVWVTNEATIQQLRDLEAGRSTANIPNGRIVRGPGEDDYNAPWGWHLDPEDIEMAEFTVEVCDGLPSYVEDNVDEFVDTVNRYCPWSAELVELTEL